MQMSYNVRNNSFFSDLSDPDVKTIGSRLVQAQNVWEIAIKERFEELRPSSASAHYEANG